MVMLEAGKAACETIGITLCWRDETGQPVRALVVERVSRQRPEQAIFFIHAGH